MKVLCTFSGKYGDILWSLPTARQIAKDIACDPVDFAMMPYYESLCPLIEAQEYIRRCFVIPDWIRTHSNHGDGPWEAPTFKEQYEGREWTATVGRHEDFTAGYLYDKVYQLTYKAHPGISAPSMALVDFVAYQQGIQLQQPVVPFISTGKKRMWHENGLMVAVAFNEQYDELKKQFIRELAARVGEMTRENHYTVDLHDVANLPWLEAAQVIEDADLFIGCRSANWVIAMGLGKQTITYEPHPSRHASCHLGKVFGCPYGQEYPLPYMMPPAVAAEAAAGMIRKRIEEVKEKVTA
jgi:hypothetical protein